MSGRNRGRPRGRPKGGVAGRGRGRGRACQTDDYLPLRSPRPPNINNAQTCNKAQGAGRQRAGPERAVGQLPVPNPPWGAPLPPVFRPVPRLLPLPLTIPRGSAHGRSGRNDDPSPGRVSSGMQTSLQTLPHSAGLGGRHGQDSSRQASVGKEGGYGRGDQGGIDLRYLPDPPFRPSTRKAHRQPRDFPFQEEFQPTYSAIKEKRISGTGQRHDRESSPYVSQKQTGDKAHKDSPHRGHGQGADSVYGKQKKDAGYFERDKEQPYSSRRVEREACYGSPRPEREACYGSPRPEREACYGSPRQEREARYSRQDRESGGRRGRDSQYGPPRHDSPQRCSSTDSSQSAESSDTSRQGSPSPPACPPPGPPARHSSADRVADFSKRPDYGADRYAPLPAPFPSSPRRQCVDAFSDPVSRDHGFSPSPYLPDTHPYSKAACPGRPGKSGALHAAFSGGDALAAPRLLAYPALLAGGDPEARLSLDLPLKRTPDPAGHGRPGSLDRAFSALADRDKASGRKKQTARSAKGDLPPAAPPASYQPPSPYYVSGYPADTAGSVTSAIRVASDVRASRCEEEFAPFRPGKQQGALSDPPRSRRPSNSASPSLSPPPCHPSRPPSPPSFPSKRSSCRQPQSQGPPSESCRRSVRLAHSGQADFPSPGPGLASCPAKWTSARRAKNDDDDGDDDDDDSPDRGDPPPLIEPMAFQQQFLKHLERQEGHLPEGHLQQQHQQCGRKAEKTEAAKASWEDKGQQAQRANQRKQEEQMCRDFIRFTWEKVQREHSRQLERLQQEQARHREHLHSQHVTQLQRHSQRELSKQQAHSQREGFLQEEERLHREQLKRLERLRRDQAKELEWVEREHALLEQKYLALHEDPAGGQPPDSAPKEAGHHHFHPAQKPFQPDQHQHKTDNEDDGRSSQRQLPDHIHQRYEQVQRHQEEELHNPRVEAGKAAQHGGASEAPHPQLFPHQHLPYQARPQQLHLSPHNPQHGDRSKDHHQYQQQQQQQHQQSQHLPGQVLPGSWQQQQQQQQQQEHQLQQKQQQLQQEHQLQHQLQQPQMLRVQQHRQHQHHAQVTPNTSEPPQYGCRQGPPPGVSREPLAPIPPWRQGAGGREASAPPALTLTHTVSAARPPAHDRQTTSPVRPGPPSLTQAPQCVARQFPHSASQSLLPLFSAPQQGPTPVHPHYLGQPPGAHRASNRPLGGYPALAGPPDAPGGQAKKPPWLVDRENQEVGVGVHRAPPWQQQQPAPVLVMPSPDCSRNVSHYGPGSSSTDCGRSLSHYPGSSSTDCGRSLSHYPGSSSHHTTPASSSHFPAPASSSHHTTPGSSSHHTTPGSSSHYPAPGSSSHHTTPGSSSHHTTPGSSSHHTTPDSSSHFTAPGSSSHYTTPGSSSYYTVSGSSSTGQPLAANMCAARAVTRVSPSGQPHAAPQAKGRVDTSHPCVPPHPQHTANYPPPHSSHTHDYKPAYNAAHPYQSASQASLQSGLCSAATVCQYSRAVYTQVTSHGQGTTRVCAAGQSAQYTGMQQFADYGCTEDPPKPHAYLCGSGERGGQASYQSDGGYSGHADYHQSDGGYSGPADYPPGLAAPPTDQECAQQILEEALNEQLSQTTMHSLQQPSTSGGAPPTVSAGVGPPQPVVDAGVCQPQAAGGLATYRLHHPFDDAGPLASSMQPPPALLHQARVPGQRGPPQSALAPSGLPLPDNPLEAAVALLNLQEGALDVQQHRVFVLEPPSRHHTPAATSEVRRNSWHTPENSTAGSRSGSLGDDDVNLFPDITADLPDDDDDLFLPPQPAPKHPPDSKLLLHNSLNLASVGLNDLGLRISSVFSLAATRRRKRRTLSDSVLQEVEVMCRHEGISPGVSQGSEVNTGSGSQHNLSEQLDAGPALSGVACFQGVDLLSPKDLKWDSCDQDASRCSPDPLAQLTKLLFTDMAVPSPGPTVMEDWNLNEAVSFEADSVCVPGAPARGNLDSFFTPIPQLYTPMPQMGTPRPCPTREAAMLFPRYPSTPSPALKMPPTPLASCAKDATSAGPPKASSAFCFRDFKEPQTPWPFQVKEFKEPDTPLPPCALGPSTPLPTLLSTPLPTLPSTPLSTLSTTPLPSTSLPSVSVKTNDPSLPLAPCAQTSWAAEDQGGQRSLPGPPLSGQGTEEPQSTEHILDISVDAFHKAISENVEKASRQPLEQAIIELLGDEPLEQLPGPSLENTESSTSQCGQHVPQKLYTDGCGESTRKQAGKFPSASKESKQMESNGCAAETPNQQTAGCVKNASKRPHVTDRPDAASKQPQRKTERVPTKDARTTHDKASKRCSSTHREKDIRDRVSDNWEKRCVTKTAGHPKSDTSRSRDSSRDSEKDRRLVPRAAEGSVSTGLQRSRASCSRSADSGVEPADEDRRSCGVRGRRTITLASRRKTGSHCSPEDSGREHQQAPSECRTQGHGREPQQSHSDPGPARTGSGTAASSETADGGVQEDVGDDADDDAFFPDLSTSDSGDGSAAEEDWPATEKRRRLSSGPCPLSPRLTVASCRQWGGEGGGECIADLILPTVLSPLRRQRKQDGGAGQIADLLATFHEHELQVLRLEGQHYVSLEELLAKCFPGLPRSQVERARVRDLNLLTRTIHVLGPDVESSEGAVTVLALQDAGRLLQYLHGLMRCPGTHCSLNTRLAKQRKDAEGADTASTQTSGTDAASGGGKALRSRFTGLVCPGSADSGAVSGDKSRKVSEKDSEDDVLVDVDGQDDSGSSSSDLTVPYCDGHPLVSWETECGGKEKISDVNSLLSSRAFTNKFRRHSSESEPRGHRLRDSDHAHRNPLSTSPESLVHKESPMLPPLPTYMSPFTPGSVYNERVLLECFSAPGSQAPSSVRSAPSVRLTSPDRHDHAHGDDDLFTALFSGKSVSDNDYATSRRESQSSQQHAAVTLSHRDCESLTSEQAYHSTVCVGKEKRTQSADDHYHDFTDDFNVEDPDDDDVFLDNEAECTKDCPQDMDSGYTQKMEIDICIPSKMGKLHADISASVGISAKSLKEMPASLLKTMAECQQNALTANYMETGDCSVLHYAWKKHPCRPEEMTKVKESLQANNTGHKRQQFVEELQDKLSKVPSKNWETCDGENNARGLVPFKNNPDSSGEALAQDSCGSSHQTGSVSGSPVKARGIEDNMDRAGGSAGDAEQMSVEDLDLPEDRATSDATLAYGASDEDTDMQCGEGVSPGQIRSQTPVKNAKLRSVHDRAGTTISHRTSLRRELVVSADALQAPSKDRDDAKLWEDDSLDKRRPPLESGGSLEDRVQTFIASGSHFTPRAVVRSNSLPMLCAVDNAARPVQASQDRQPGPRAMAARSGSYPGTCHSEHGTSGAQHSPVPSPVAHLLHHQHAASEQGEDSSASPSPTPCAASAQSTQDTGDSAVSGTAHAAAAHCKNRMFLGSESQQPCSVVDEGKEPYSVVDEGKEPCSVVDEGEEPCSVVDEEKPCSIEEEACGAVEEPCGVVDEGKEPCGVVDEGKEPCGVVDGGEVASRASPQSGPDAGGGGYSGEQPWQWAVPCALHGAALCGCEGIDIHTGRDAACPSPKLIYSPFPVVGGMTPARTDPQDTPHHSPPLPPYPDTDLNNCGTKRLASPEGQPDPKRRSLMPTTAGSDSSNPPGDSDDTQSVTCADTPLFEDEDSVSLSRKGSPLFKDEDSLPLARKGSPQCRDEDGLPLARKGSPQCRDEDCLPLARKGSPQCRDEDGTGDAWGGSLPGKGAENRGTGAEGSPPSQVTDNLYPKQELSENDVSGDVNPSTEDEELFLENEKQALIAAAEESEKAMASLSPEEEQKLQSKSPDIPVAATSRAGVSDDCSLQWNATHTVSDGAARKCQTMVTCASPDRSKRVVAADAHSSVDSLHSVSETSNTAIPSNLDLMCQTSNTTIPSNLDLMCQTSNTTITSNLDLMCQTSNTTIPSNLDLMCQTSNTTIPSNLDLICQTSNTTIPGSSDLLCGTRSTTIPRSLDSVCETKSTMVSEALWKAKSPLSGESAITLNSTSHANVSDGCITKSLPQANIVEASTHILEDSRAQVKGDRGEGGTTGNTEVSTPSSLPTPSDISDTTSVGTADSESVNDVRIITLGDSDIDLTFESEDSKDGSDTGLPRNLPCIESEVTSKLPSIEGKKIITIAQYKERRKHLADSHSTVLLSVRAMDGGLSTCTSPSTVHGGLSTCTSPSTVHGGLSTCTSPSTVHGGLSTCTSPSVVHVAPSAAIRIKEGSGAACPQQASWPAWPVSVQQVTADSAAPKVLRTESVPAELSRKVKVELKRSSSFHGQHPTVKRFKHQPDGSLDSAKAELKRHAHGSREGCERKPSLQSPPKEKSPRVKNGTHVSRDMSVDLPLSRHAVSVDSSKEGKKKDRRKDRIKDRIKDRSKDRRTDRSRDRRKDRSPKATSEARRRERREAVKRVKAPPGGAGSGRVVSGPARTADQEMVWRCPDPLRPCSVLVAKIALPAPPARPTGEGQEDSLIVESETISITCRAEPAASRLPNMPLDDPPAERMSRSRSPPGQRQRLAEGVGHGPSSVPPAAGNQGPCRRQQGPPTSSSHHRKSLSEGDSENLSGQIRVDEDSVTVDETSDSGESLLTGSSARTRDYVHRRKKPHPSKPHPGSTRHMDCRQVSPKTGPTTAQTETSCADDTRHEDLAEKAHDSGSPASQTHSADDKGGVCQSGGGGGELSDQLAALLREKERMLAEFAERNRELEQKLRERNDR
ncbi:hypothetical protein ACOMHN_052836 [Nucella lapillus]